VILVTSTGAIRITRRKPQRLRRIVAWMWFLGKCMAAITACVALGVGAYTGYLVVRDAEYFRLQTVHIVGNQTLTRQDIHYLLALPGNVTLFQLDLPRMGDRLQRHPYVKAVALRRQFPDTLTVTITERVPHLVAFSQDQGVLLDTTGVVLRAFSPQHDSALPQLHLRQQRVLEPGMHLRQDEVQRALELVRVYRASVLAGAARLVALRVEDSGVSVWELASYPFTVRLGEGNVEAQLGRLLPVLQYITQQRLVIRGLDLSYNRRVVIVPVKT
jgi:cell division protein FtsQ